MTTEETAERIEYTAMEEIKNGEQTASEAEVATEKKKKTKKSDEALKAAEAELEKLRAELEESKDKYLRLAAEYDNFRKRTAKEREGIYSDAYEDALKNIFPIIDNIERAAACEDGQGVADGVKLTLAQCETALSRMGVEAIKSDIGDAFDPELHNAVMHTESDELGESVVAAVFQKGYKKGSRVLRYAMVSVAN